MPLGAFRVWFFTQAFCSRVITAFVVDRYVYYARASLLPFSGGFVINTTVVLLPKLQT
jgi:hypothetical protein